MKKSGLILAIALQVTFQVFPETADVTAKWTGPQKTKILDVEVKANEVVAFPLNLTDTISSGMRVTPPTTEVMRSGKSKTKAPVLKQIVARIQGTWYVFQPQKDGGALSQYRVNFDEPYTLAPTVLANAAIKLRNSNYLVNAEVAVLDKPPVDHPSRQALVSEKGIVDPSQLDNRTFYLVSDDFKTGIQVVVGRGYSFELEESDLFQNRDTESVRQTLMYWILGLGPVGTSAGVVDPEAFRAKMPQFDLALYQRILQNPSAAGRVRSQLLSLLLSQLEVSSSKVGDQVSQTWQFPAGSELYPNGNSPTPYSRLFFQILERFTMVTSPQDNGAQWTYPDRATLAQRAKEYLLGVETKVPDNLASIYGTLKTNSNIDYHPKDSLGLPLDGNLNAIPQPPFASTSWSFSSPLSDKQTDFSSVLPLSPPGNSILTNATLTAASAAKAQNLLGVVVRPVGIPETSIELVFNTPQKVRSILAWLGPGETLKVEYWTGTKYEQTANQHLTYAHRKAVGPGFQWEGIGNPEPGEAFIGVVDFDQVVTTSRLRITVPGKRLFGLRGYTEPFNLASNVNTTRWMADSAAHTLALTTNVSAQWPELFWAQGGNDVLYFSQSGAAVVPGGPASPWSEYYSPIRYAAAGLETPRSFAMKVINNQEWKKQYPLAGSRFPLTELDLESLTVTDGFLYKNNATAPTNLKAPVLHTTMYPFGYGITLPSLTGVVPSPQSPFFVEKLAGVDSPGMLLSLLKTLNLGTRTDAFLDARFDTRTKKLPGYDAFVDPNLWQNYLPTSSYRVQADWFLRNSYALTDLSEILPGDILVGYEGRELNVAVVVKGNLTADLNSAETNVEVVTINRSLQRAVYTNWKSMSQIPGAYHARRLVVTKDGSTSSATAIDGFIKYQQSITYSMDRPDPDHFGFWIPNTQEAGWIGQLTLHGDGLTNDVVSGRPWTINTAWDYSGDQALGGNISVNSGNTIFHLVALQDGLGKETGVSVPITNGIVTGPGYYEVARFIKQPGAVNLSIVWNNGGGSLEVEETHLAVKLGQAPTFRQFAIVAENPVPGDDLGLSFKVEASTGTLVTSLAQAPRLAVYDKKLLWRANLYLDEGRDDWNSRHPWVTDNDWNVKEDGTRGNGEQVIGIRPWTRFSDGSKIQNSTPYGWGGSETPFTNNTALSVQATAIGSLRNSNQIYAKLSWSQNSSYAPTKAPKSSSTDWNNYVFPFRVLTQELQSLIPKKYYIYNPTVAQRLGGSGIVASVLDQHLFNIDGSTARIPGLSTFLAFYDQMTNDYLSNNSITRNLEGQLYLNGDKLPNMGNSLVFTIGSDCSGFVFQASRYKDSNYKAALQRIYSGDFGNNAYTTSIVPVPNNIQDTPVNLDKVVPGDLLVLGGVHVAIVQRITRNADGSPLSRSNLTLIQSTQGPKEDWQVMNKLNWKSGQGLGARYLEYQIRRLSSN